MIDKRVNDIPLRVLIVDDERQIGEFLYEFLSDQGYEVFYADSGSLALRFVKRARPHIVLLDVRMDGMDGLETLKRILEIDPKAGVIMVTAMQDEDIGRQALKLGAVDFISKPVDFEYLETSLLVKLSSIVD